MMKECKLVGYKNGKMIGIKRVEFDCELRDYWYCDNDESEVELVYDDNNKIIKIKLIV